MKEPPKPIQGIAKAVVLLLVAQIVIAIAEAIALAHRIDVLQQLRNGSIAAAREGAAADDFVTTMATFDTIAFLTTVVIWCIWQHRAQTNAIELAGGGLRFTPGWAVGWWFIPIANLWKPFQAVRELWKASHGGVAWQSLRTWPVIGWWWAIWMVSLVHVWFGEHSGGVSFGTMPMGTPITPTDIVTRDKWQILSLALRVFAAALAIKIVRSVVHAQETAPPRAAMPVGQPDFAIPDPPQRPDMATPG